MNFKEKSELKIYQGVFDNYTMRTLIKLADKRHFVSLDFPISTGKEADVYRVTTKEGFAAVKIYRIETSNFKAMQNYLIGDPRFARIRKSKRGIIDVWCQKEFSNLQEALKIGINVPKPIAFEKNILVMEFLGTKNGSPYPLLKNVKPKNPEKLIKILSDYIKKMWKAKLVHGDLNEFNIMMKGQTPIIIDIGQAMNTRHPIALELLKRDLGQVAKLAKKYKVEYDAEKIIKQLVKEMK